MCNLMTVFIVIRYWWRVLKVLYVRRYAENLFTSTLELSRCLTQIFDGTLRYILFISYGNLFVWGVYLA